MATKKTPVKKTPAKTTSTKKGVDKKTTSTKKSSTKEGGKLEKLPKAKAATLAIESPAIEASDAPYEGVALVNRVIELVKEKGFSVLGGCGLPKNYKATPVPADILETLTFPNGKPLPPSLKTWLAFDGGWLDWFADVRNPEFSPLKLGEYTLAEYDFDWGYGDIEKAFFKGDCYGLHFGSDSRRFLYVGTADALGEYPVCLVDTDDTPYLGIEFPGFDVYLGYYSGLVKAKIEHYGALVKDKRFEERMKFHGKKSLRGEVHYEFY